MRFREVIEQLKWLKRNGKWPADDEPCLLKFPRIEAKRRIRNEKKSKRVVFVVDEQAYSEWNAERERYMQAANENPTTAYYYMLNAIRAFPVETIAVEDQDA